MELRAILFCLAIAHLTSLVTDLHLWHKPKVRLVIEKVIVFLCLGLLMANILSNPMGLDKWQRVFLGLALLFFACFLTYTVYRLNEVDRKIEVPDRPNVFVR